MKVRPIAKAEMLIRRPVAEVYEAFVDPAVTSHFWFTRGSARLEADKVIEWEWKMYGFSIHVHVKELVRDRKILIEWPADGGMTTVEWLFSPRPGGSTFVSITNSGFTGDDDAVLAQVVGSTEGFAIVLAGLKAYLEKGITLNLIQDRFPDGLGT